MGKNNSGGKKQKKQKNTIVKASTIKIEEITPNDEDLLAGMITRTLGCCRFEVTTLDGKNKYQAGLPGSSRKGPRVKIGDCVLIQYVAELTGNNCYIKYIYNDDDLRQLELTKPRTNIGGDIDLADDDELINFDNI